MDLFGYLSIILHGLVIVAQSMAVGGVLFLVLLALPFAAGPAGRGRGAGGAAGVGGGGAGAGLAEGAELARRTARLAAWSAAGLVLGEALTVAMQSAVLVDTLQLPVGNVLGAAFARAGLVKMAAAGLLAACLFARRRVAAAPMLVLCAVILGAAVAT